MGSQSDSVGYTIMLQLSRGHQIIHTLDKEGKAQKVTATEAGCYQSAVSKHILGKLENPLLSC